MKTIFETQMSASLESNLIKPLQDSFKKLLLQVKQKERKEKEKERK